MIGLFLTFDGLSVSNGSQMIIGIYFTLTVIFSICVIHYNKMSTGKLNLFHSSDWNPIIKFLQKIGEKNEKNYYLFLFYTFVILFIIWLTTFLLNKQRGVHWHSILGFVGIPMSFILSYSVFALCKPFGPVSQ
jgi:hypothetical protein